MEWGCLCGRRDTWPLPGRGLCGDRRRPVGWRGGPTEQAGRDEHQGQASCEPAQSCRHRGLEHAISHVAESALARLGDCDAEGGHRPARPAKTSRHLGHARPPLPRAVPGVAQSAEPRRGHCQRRASPSPAPRRPDAPRMPETRRPARSARGWLVSPTPAPYAARARAAPPRRTAAWGTRDNPSRARSPTWRSPRSSSRSLPRRASPSPAPRRPAAPRHA